MDTARLRPLVPLNALSRENLEDLAKKTSIEQLPDGAFIFKPGDTDHVHIFVLAGAVELLGGEGEIRSVITAGTSEALHALADSLPRTLTARVKDSVEYIEIDSDLLDMMLTWDQTATGYEVEELSPDSGPSDANDWMTRILQTKAFHRVPPANIQAMFMRMEPVYHDAGDVVIQQGDDGEYFFIVKDGRCSVSRSSTGSGSGVRLAELKVGDSFGEEALISNNKRNATVTMLTSGTLMRLSKQDFMSLLNEPMLNWVTFEEAVELIATEHAKWLDVRLPGEYAKGHVHDSLNIPLIFLRMKLSTLDENGKYIVYCDTGRRSSAAAYLLGERGYDAHVLKDGTAEVIDAAWEGDARPARPDRDPAADATSVAS